MIISNTSNHYLFKTGPENFIPISVSVSILFEKIKIVKWFNLKNWNL